MAVLEKGNTLFGAEPGHCKRQTGVNQAIEARHRLINTELIVRFAEPTDVRSIAFIAVREPLAI